MSTGGPFPSRDADFDNYLQHAKPYLITNKTRLGVSAANVSSLNSLFTEWNTIYQQSQDKQQRTTAITNQKNELAKQLKVLLRKIYNDIPDSVLTDDDRSSLNIKARDFNPTPVPLPDHSPTVSIDQMGHLFHELRFRDPDNPDSKAKPFGVKQTEVWIALTPIGGSQQPQFDLLGNTGRFLFQADFDEADVGKIANYKARYINSRGEKGPWSIVVSAVIG